VTGDGHAKQPPSRLEGLIASLCRFYGPLTAPPRTPFGVFVWHVLSVHSTARQRDAALRALRRIRALTPDAMSRAPQKALEDSVALAGAYAEQRLRALRRGVDVFRRVPELSELTRGPIGPARRALGMLPHMHDGGVRRLLLFGGNRPLLPIDSGTARVLSRLGYGQPPSLSIRRESAVRKAAEREVRRDVDAFRRAFLYLSHHSTATCTESHPHCAVCPLLEECPHGRARTAS
jgi:endonuclease III